MDKDLVRALRARGVDVLTALDFLRQGRSHTGMVLARQQQHSVGEQMRRLLKLMAVLSADEIKNRVEFLSAWS